MIRDSQLAQLRLLAACLILACVPPARAAANSPRDRLSLDAGWTFHLGDNRPGAQCLDKAGANTWEIKLTATVAGLTPETAAVKTQPGKSRPLCRKLLMQIQNQRDIAK